MRRLSTGRTPPACTFATGRRNAAIPIPARSRVIQGGLKSDVTEVANVAGHDLDALEDDPVGMGADLRTVTVQARPGTTGSILNRPWPSL